MLELRDVSFDVQDDKGEKEIIKHLDLQVEDGKFVVVTGPNGGGKSTMAKLIAGIESPSSGSILFNGEDITDKSITERARLGISFAFQQPVRFKGITVLDLLRIAAQKRLSVAEACAYLSEVGLCARDYVNREVNASLSGGELKRIEIATVLARGTKLAIFDEPEAGIDLWRSSRSPMRSSSWRTAGSPSTAPGRRSCPGCWVRPTRPTPAPCWIRRAEPCR